MSQRSAWQFRSWVGVFTVLLLACYGVSASGADTIYVDDDAPNDPGPGDPAVSDPLEDGSAEHPFDAIQEGIDTATDGDTVLVADGTYTGVGNKNLDFGGKPLALRSESGPQSCVIDCDQDGRGFYFHSGETADAIVDGFTITNSFTDDWATGAVVCQNAGPTITHCRITGNTGSGIFSYGGSPVIRHCTISDNVGTLGVWITAGITLVGGDATVEGCTITRNAMDSVGGVLFDGGNLTLTDSMITANVITGGIGDGGGVAVFGDSATVSNCTIAGNVGGYFGGGVNAWGDVTISDCTIAGNSASLLGGGLYLQGGSVTIVDCFIMNNSAEQGGGIFQYDVSTTIVDCTIYGNSAQEGGGVCGTGFVTTVVGCTIVSNLASAAGAGVAFYAGELTLANCTLAENTADGTGGGALLGTCSATIANCAIVDNTAGDKGGGIYYLRHSDVTLVNSILWGNAAEFGHQIGGGRAGVAALLSVSFSDVEGGEAAAYVEDGCTLNWGPGNLDAYPRFVDYFDGDYRLRPGSPCIDAGCNWGVPPDSTDLDDDGDTDEITPLDLEGEGRFFDDPDTPDTGCGYAPIVDKGAYEFGGTGPQPCFADLDNDRDVDLADLAALLANYGSSEVGDSDLDCDGVVGLDDLAALLAVYGMSCE